MITADKPTVIVMTLMKSTQGTHVYCEPNVPGKTFPVVYIQRAKLTDPPPHEIEVTVRALG